MDYETQANILKGRIRELETRDFNQNSFTDQRDASYRATFQPIQHSVPSH